MPDNEYPIGENKLEFGNRSKAPDKKPPDKILSDKNPRTISPPDKKPLTIRPIVQMPPENKSPRTNARNKISFDFDAFFDFDEFFTRSCKTTEEIIARYAVDANLFLRESSFLKKTYFANLIQTLKKIHNFFDT